MNNQTNSAPYIHRQKLLYFWGKFGGTKNDGRKYNQVDKLNALIELSNIKIYYKTQQTLIKRRNSFNKIKNWRHNPLTHKWCFVCLEKPDVRHHIIQLQYGGINCKKNIVSLCNSCHSKVHPWLE